MSEAMPEKVQDKMPLFRIECHMKMSDMSDRLAEYVSLCLSHQLPVGGGSLEEQF